MLFLLSTPMGTHFHGIPTPSSVGHRVSELDRTLDRAWETSPLRPSNPSSASSNVCFLPGYDYLLWRHSLDKTLQIMDLWKFLIFCGWQKTTFPPHKPQYCIIEKEISTISKSHHEKTKLTRQTMAVTWGTCQKLQFLSLKTLLLIGIKPHIRYKR